MDEEDDAGQQSAVHDAVGGEDEPEDLRSGSHFSSASSLSHTSSIFADALDLELRCE